FREMMLYHTRHFEDVETKVAEARKMLNFVLANNKGKETPYAKALESELNLIRTLEDYYFYKEYLSSINDPVYFSDFIEAANATGLRYVGDMDLEFMYLGNYDELAQSQLGTLTTAVQQEQYMDFIVNRRVRNTVLGKSAAVNRSIDAGRLKDFKFRLKLLPINPIVEETFEGGVVELRSSENNEITAKVTGRERIAFVDYMVSSHPRSLGMDEIREGAAARAGVEAGEAKANLQRFLVGAIASGLCGAEREPDLFVLEASEKPEVFSFSRYQCEVQILVNNARHQTVQISAIDQRLIPLLDGEHDMEQLVDEVRKRFESGDLSLSIEGVDKDAETPEPSKFVQALIEQRLRFYAVNALLVA
ncbi:MAG: methyltransferase regulatory domain-containing protein, partial [Gammaproteobacteria bacterium]